MPEPEAAPARAEGGMSLFQRILLGGSFYFALNAGVNKFFSKGQSAVQVQDASGRTINVPGNLDTIPAYQLRPATLDEGAKYAAVPLKVAPIWPTDSLLDIVVTVSPTSAITPLDHIPPEFIALNESAFHLGDYSDQRIIDAEFPVPRAVQRNGTLWGHFYVGLSGAEIDPTKPDFSPAEAYHFAYPLTQYLPKKRESRTRNLLDDAPPTPEELLAEEELRKQGPLIASYYHPNVSFEFVPDLGIMDYAQAHFSARAFTVLESTGARDGSGQNSWYYPVLFVNQFWQLIEHMNVVNETVTTLPIHINLNNIASWKFKAISSIEISNKETLRRSAWGQTAPGGGDGTEIEMIKNVLLDNNPVLLGITVLVSIAHMILETLAFGSDIAHYRKKKDNVGISVRSILANVFMQTVILLYLIDNSQTTSWMILGSQVVGIVIELWKITTVVNIVVQPAGPTGWLPYRIAFEDKTVLSETEEKTKEYDQIAFNYMYMAGVPLLLAYAAYSLIYDSHKSWYSYIIATLVGSVYAYGFLLMVPSLYINYRLKSVAHMPGKAMMYKFFNTFIDDLFAFAIKMPFLHRLATFRDDVIFFIYLYQRWAYRVDYTRVNEFGQGGDDENDEPTATATEKKDGPAEIEDKSKTESVAKATGADKSVAKKRK
ncbi:Cleft lip and palate transmembrane protein 1 -like protein [Ceratocystis fimbriata CBS 114723]|uniref:Cleft lip and palate transmembrane protein 1-like protein n=1 Tax=Ceratocystis fimbriata CBS 114723 TaxID=1035309 RepID=A0A2C5XKK1_9PEZI|nr:Cleft lip and palate transmembrane protein 1 -like protein [Ceratocystis fimbriata CBS 114723]